jgi:hypothetical protein
MIPLKKKKIMLGSSCQEHPKKYCYDVGVIFLFTSYHYLDNRNLMTDAVMLVVSKEQLAMIHVVSNAELINTTNVACGHIFKR